MTSRLFVIEEELRNTDFSLFCSGVLDLDPMTFIYELGPYYHEIYRISDNELRTSRFSKLIVLQKYRQTAGTDRQTRRNVDSQVANELQH